MKHVLVTGGLGFIGRALALALVARGNQVTVLDNLSPQIHGEVPLVSPPLGVRVIRCDVRELAERWQLLDDVDTVAHLAAETGTAQSMYRISHYVGVNDMGLAALLEGLCKARRRPRKLLLASSRSVYGEGAYSRDDQPGHVVQPRSRSWGQLQAGDWALRDIDGADLRSIATPESLPFSPGSVYAATKAAQELLLQSAAKSLGVECVILRLQNVYGEGQSLQNPYTGIISIFFNRARQGMAIQLYEDGHPSRDFVHVSDVVQAMIVAMEASLPDGLVINVGAGRATSVAELAHALTVAAQLSVPIQVTGRFRMGDIRHCHADLDLARRWLGYSPSVTLAHGLKNFVTWAEDQPIHVDLSQLASAELRERQMSN